MLGRSECPEGSICLVTRISSQDNEIKTTRRSTALMLEFYVPENRMLMSSRDLAGWITSHPKILRIGTERRYYVDPSPVPIALLLLGIGR